MNRSNYYSRRTTSRKFRPKDKRSLSSSEEDKSFRICSVFGGLDVTRFVSRDARSFFAGAIDDVELIREVITETALNGGIGHRMTLAELNSTLDRIGRGFDHNDTIKTTMDAALSYVDDRPDRRIDFWVGQLNLGDNKGHYYNSSSEIDAIAELAFVQAAALIFPWVLDRKSKPEYWFVDHQNGRSVGSKKEPFKFDSLYTAAWIGSWGESWLYYPPINKLTGEPTTVSDPAGGGLSPDDSSHEMPFVKANLPWNNEARDVFFTSPYPDVARAGLAMVSAIGPLYFTGSIANKTYDDTYMASTGVDIGLDSVSKLLDVLTDRLTVGSFALITDFDLDVVVISQDVVKKIYPERTGFEKERVTYDNSGEVLMEDRRNVTYTPADTLYQGLPKLDNAKWGKLRESLESLNPGDRDYTRLNITLTGDEEPIEHYVFYEKWKYVADWALLAFAPVKEVDNAMQVHIVEGSRNSSAMQTDDRIIQSLTLNVRQGKRVSGQAAILNSGTLGIVVSSSGQPDWLKLHQSISQRHINAGEVLALDFDILTEKLDRGTTASFVSFHIRDDSYPDCFYDQERSLKITVNTYPSYTFYLILAGALISACIALYAYVEQKRREADSVWIVDKCELIYDNPPEVLGRGTFGLVVAAEYRGTRVAVKRVIPPNQENENSSTVIFDHDEDDSSASEESAILPTTVRPQSKRRLLSKGMRSGESIYGSVEAYGSVGSKATTGSKSYAYLHGSFIEEMRVLSKLRHPCVTAFMGAVIARKEDPLLVMELMDRGSLYDLLHNMTMVFEGDIILYILRDISQGMRFLHSASPQIIHGDLKAANVLVDSRFRAKVTDFGFIIKQKVGASGTPYWMAPELLSGSSGNSSASDVYSFGIMLYEVYSRKLPYEEEEVFDAVIRNICDPSVNKRPRIPESMPSEVASLLYSVCLEADPAARPTFVELDGFLKRFAADNVDIGDRDFIGGRTDRSNSLLEELFPPHIAQALREGRRPEPEDFECVTIFFSDIVGFTTLSSNMEAKKVTDMVNRLYHKMDALSTKYSVQKLETIGDAWVGATNLYSPNPNDHVKRVAQFSIDVLKAARSTLIDEDDTSQGNVEIRIGFHSGPCTAAVVGTKLPKVSVFGDTINTASRMESNSKPGRIHISDRSEALLREQAPELTTKCRGNIQVKGKGNMVTYWVLGE